MAAPDVSAIAADTEGIGWRYPSPRTFLLPAPAYPQCRQVPGKQHTRPLFPGEWRPRMRLPFSFSMVSDACSMAKASPAGGLSAASSGMARIA
jgi:hypothetical protein